MGLWPIVVRGLEAVGLQDVSAHPWGQSLMVRPTVHRVVGVMVVQMTLIGAKVVVMAGIHFVTLAVLMTRTIVMGSVRLVAVVEAGLVFATLIMVLMMRCVLLMD